MTEVSNTLVILLGLGTVFVGLICLIVICYIMGAIVKGLTKQKMEEAPNTAPAPASTSKAVINKGEFAAAIAAAIAEDLGTDVTGIRIKSVKKI